MVSSRLTTGVLGRTLDSIPPAAGADVMATGIVSVALSLDGQETLSRVLLAIAAVIWVTLAAAEHTRWLLIAAIAPFALGLALYVFVISRFDLDQLAVGRGDHWIAGGAVGIAALAATTIAGGAKTLGIAGGLESAFRDIAIGLWVLTMLWLLVLLFAEARWPRLSVGAPRWSTVFPLGMYAASSFAVGAIAHVNAITSFARVWVWIALASWAIVLAATIARAVDVVCGQGPPRTVAP
jgi:tellurite resistance protein TehA-like permease